MDEDAYLEYRDESADWLKTGRANLLRVLLERHRPRGGHLELLELGAGVGQNLPVLTPFGVVDAAEINPLGQAAIRSQQIARNLYTEPLPFVLDRTYDVICALDVVEHIDDDRSVLRWVGEHLRRDGTFIATVPAYPWLFSDHDRALHHFRRYTCATFCRALPETLRVDTAAYFNHLLFPAAVVARGTWSFKRMLLGAQGGKQRTPRSGAVQTLLGRVLDVEVSLIQRGYEPPWGLSVYCVARRR